MTVNYTKRQYLADIAANEADQAAVVELLASFHARLEAGESIHALSDAWNAAHDREYDLEQERADIERRWSRRHWTGADYALRELVAANID
jgi:hypothetical protein